VGAIPARYGSTRLPGKALLEIDGRSMVEHVYRKALQVKGLTRVVILTDDDRIAAEARKFGGECEMTPVECASGTDRIAHAARRWRDEGLPVDAVVNVQGDEPLIDPGAIERLATHLAAAPEDGMATLAAPLDPGRLGDPNSVKVVTNQAGYALYFSRAGIPYPRNSEALKPRLHIGVYGYRTETLLRLAALPESPLEKAESLEQLRALDHGISIRVLATEHAWRGIDTIEDLEEIRRWFAGERAASAGIG